MDFSGRLRAAIQEEKERIEVQEQQNAGFRKDWEGRTQEILSILREAAAGIEAEKLFAKAVAVEEHGTVTLTLHSGLLGSPYTASLSFSAEPEKTIRCRTSPFLLEMEDRLSLGELTDETLQDKVEEFALAVYRSWHEQAKRSSAWLPTRSKGAEPGFELRASGEAGN